MVAYKSLKIKEKSSWVIPKVVAVAYESLSLHRSNRVSQKLVVTRAGCLWEWSQGELFLEISQTVIPSTGRPFKLFGVSCMTLRTYDLVHLLYFIMPALSFDSIDQENFFKHRRLHLLNLNVEIMKESWIWIAYHTFSVSCVFVVFWVV